MIVIYSIQYTKFTENLVFYYCAVYNKSSHNKKILRKTEVPNSVI